MCVCVCVCVCVRAITWDGGDNRFVALARSLPAALSEALSRADNSGCVPHSDRLIRVLPADV